MTDLKWRFVSTICACSAAASTLVGFEGSEGALHWTAIDKGDVANDRPFLPEMSAAADSVHRATSIQGPERHRAGTILALKLRLDLCAYFGCTWLLVCACAALPVAIALPRRGPADACQGACVLF